MGFCFNAGSGIAGNSLGIMVLGVYITFKILDIADLTVDGSFALGDAYAPLIVAHGWNPVAALLISLVAGVIAGGVTGFLHTVFEIPVNSGEGF